VVTSRTDRRETWEDRSSWRRWYQEIVASEGPETLVRTTRWLIPALAPEERAVVVGGARSGIPAPVFDQLLGMIQGLISPGDWTKLSGALELIERAPA
jgi:hypothetical protein